MKKVFRKVKEFFAKWFRTYTVTRISETPYVVRYKNNSTEKKTGVLFGADAMSHNDNFGNGEKVDIENLMNPTVGYRGLLDMSARGIYVGRMKFVSDNFAFIPSQICFIHENAGNGRKYTTWRYALPSPYQSMPVITTDEFKDRLIDSSSRFEFELRPNANLIIAMYPLELKTVNYSQLLRMIRRKSGKSYKNYLPCIMLNMLYKVIKKFKKRKYAIAAYV
jgi:hypothetical protein